MIKSRSILAAGLALAVPSSLGFAQIPSNAERARIADQLEAEADAKWEAEQDRDDPNWRTERAERETAARARNRDEETEIAGLRASRTPKATGSTIPARTAFEQIGTTKLAIADLDQIMLRTGVMSKDVWHSGAGIRQITLTADFVERASGTCRRALQMHDPVVALADQVRRIKLPDETPIAYSIVCKSLWQGYLAGLEDQAARDAASDTP